MKDQKLMFDLFFIHQENKTEEKDSFHLYLRKISKLLDMDEYLSNRR